jgi:hypothetical protein
VSLRRFSVTAGSVAGIVLGALVLAWPRIRDADASVSIPVTFEDLVQRASAAVVVTPLEQYGVWEDGRIATYTHVRVERRVAGRLTGEVWVRSEGGSVGNIGQLVEGEAAFAMGKASLVFLHPHGGSASATTFGVVEGAQGQFPIVTLGRASPRLVASPSLGGILPSSSTQPLARDILVDVSLEEAATAIAAAWSHWHSAGQGAR